MNAKSIIRDGLPTIPQRQAFALAHLAAAVEDARLIVERQRAVLHAARGADKAQARRAFKRAQGALAEAERALSAEHRGERFAPAVQRQTITHGDVVLREARVIQHGKSIALVSALDRLRTKSSITDAQHAGGRRYLYAYEMAHMDSFPIGLGEGAGGGSPSGGNRRIENAVGASADLRALRTVLGRYGVGLIEHVVVHDLDVSAWAERHAMDRKGAMGQLQLLLGMLADAP